MNKQLVKKTVIDMSIWIWGILGSLIFLALGSNQAMAFNKLKNGFETITNSYLLPLSGAVAGAAFIAFVILSYFKQDEYQKKVGNVLVLTIFSATGLELVNSLIQSFS